MFAVKERRQYVVAVVGVNTGVVRRFVVYVVPVPFFTGYARIFKNHPAYVLPLVAVTAGGGRRARVNGPLRGRVKMFVGFAVTGPGMRGLYASGVFARFRRLIRHVFPP